VPAFSPQERVKFFKLAWDALGSEFASRGTCSTKCSMPARLLRHPWHSYRTFDWAKCKGMVVELMASYPTPAAPRKSAGTQ
jgi:4-hydroxyphenylacetate 3-monooxygenase